MDSPENSSMFLIEPLRKFNDGRLPSLLKTAVFAIVPMFLYFSVAFPILFLLNTFLLARNASSSAESTTDEPRNEIAFNFLDPITAPVPVRPACRPPSLLMVAKRTRFSPAGPMQAIL